MFELITIYCPHCRACGQILRPPEGSVIIGPCPECHGLILIFAAETYALDKDQMDYLEGRSLQIERLMTQLTDKIHKRIVKTIDGQLGKVSASNLVTHPSDCDEFLPENPGEISESEVDKFVHAELKLMDNPDYFKLIFRRGDNS